MKLREAPEAINHYLAGLQSEGFHLQNLSVKSDGTVMFQDRSAQVAVDLFPHLDIKGKRVLCVGANTGQDADVCFGAGAREVVVLEYVPQLCSVASVLLMLGRGDSKWMVVCGSIEDPNPEVLSWGHFDVVYMPGVLYHLRSPMLALQKCHGLLKPGGVLAIETMLASSDLPEDTVVYYPVGHPSDYAKKHNYPNYFLPTPEVVQSWLKDAGFDPAEQVIGPNVRGAFVTSRI